MKIENLIKYWKKVQAGFQEDDSSQKKHFKMVAEALESYEKMLLLDVTSKVKPERYDETTKTFHGNCQRCKYSVNSEWDFCPRCGHPLEFEKSTTRRQKSRNNSDKLKEKKQK